MSAQASFPAIATLTHRVGTTDTSQKLWILVDVIQGLRAELQAGHGDEAFENQQKPGEPLRRRLLHMLR